MLNPPRKLKTLLNFSGIFFRCSSTYQPRKTIMKFFDVSNPAHQHIISTNTHQVAVTFTADQFQGIYREKQYHEADFGEVLKRAKEHNCEKVMLTTMTLEGAKQNLQAVREFPTMCKMTLGVHPYHAAEIYEQPGSQYLNELKQLGESLLAQSPSPLAAFGEIGLDYEYLNRADKETQQRAFREQLELAIHFQLPLSLHVRESAEDFISIIRPYLERLPKGGLVHSFAGTKEEMLQLVGLGLEISVNGVSFRTDEQLDMVKHILLDRLQLETDAPWCEVLGNDPKIAGYLGSARPLPASRKHNKFILGQMVKTRNESCTMERVGLVVAGLKRVSIEEVVNAAWDNSCRMFWE
jgi:TatD DNase family protein